MLRGSINVLGSDGLSAINRENSLVTPRKAGGTSLDPRLAVKETPRGTHSVLFGMFLTHAAPFPSLIAKKASKGLSKRDDNKQNVSLGPIKRDASSMKLSRQPSQEVEAPSFGARAPSSINVSKPRPVMRAPTRPKVRPRVTPFDIDADIEVTAPYQGATRFDL